MVSENTPDFLRDLSEKKVGEWLKLPEDLSGKSVLEVFSSSGLESMKAPIERRGGRYFSVDMYHPNDGDHVNADAGKLPYKDESFDHVVMSGPLFWGGRKRGFFEKLFNKSMLNDRSFPVLAECARVLKNEPGSSVKVASGFTLDDLADLRRT